MVYISWLDCHPDKMKVVGSSPTTTTNNKKEVIAKEINDMKEGATRKELGLTANQNVPIRV